MRNNVVLASLLLLPAVALALLLLEALDPVLIISGLFIVGLLLVTFGWTES
jgi:hypothetical protein